MTGIDTGVAAAILLLLVVVLVRELAPPAAAMLGALIACVLFGLIPAVEAFAGFSNPATISIGGLFVIARAVRDRAGIDQLTGRFLGDGSDGERPALVRFIPPVILLSGFMDNTPLVAAGAPVIRSWGEKHGVAASKLLMPLSFAAILGGVLTLIGTGPNLVSGMLVAAGESRLGVLRVDARGHADGDRRGRGADRARPTAVPDRRTPHEQIAAHERDYTVRLRVSEDGPLDGCTVADAGLRDLPGTFLASVLHEGSGHGPATPGTRLHRGDELVFVGSADSVRDLLDRPGLTAAEQAQTSSLASEGHALFECIVGSNSHLVGTTMKEVSFRGRYGGTVVALHRASERVDGKLGGVELRGGDALLVLADADFAERWNGRRDFALVVAQSPASADASRGYRWLRLGTFVGMVLLAGTGLLPVLTAILLACTVLVATGAIRFGRAVDALDLDVLLVVAAAIGLGGAMTAAGLTGLVAGGIEALAVAGGALIALAAVAVGTMLLTELLTNVAAAALMLPIALDVAKRVDANPTAFAVAVALAASASFLTPIGYQTTRSSTASVVTPSGTFGVSGYLWPPLLLSRF